MSKKYVVVHVILAKLELQRNEYIKIWYINVHSGIIVILYKLNI